MTHDCDCWQPTVIFALLQKGFSETFAVVTENHLAAGLDGFDAKLIVHKYVRFDFVHS